jgi:hypothetical protein
MFCSDQTSMLGCLWGTCALGGLILWLRRKVIEFLGVSMVFTFSLIASLWINECLCFMPSRDRRDGLVCSKVAQLCSTLYHSS